MEIKNHCSRWLKDLIIFFTFLVICEIRFVHLLEAPPCDINQFHYQRFIHAFVPSLPRGMQSIEASTPSRKKLLILVLVMGHSDPLDPAAIFFCLRGTGSFEDQLFIPQHTHHISILNQEQERVRHYVYHSQHICTHIQLYVFSVYF